ncbi:hypothetical protein [Mesorhizobium silamurunense]|uniref:hypothetical protein n=1 Tax=Mesorhizobium silamurunense TaxID=499528 RepID=UPI00177E04B3|nr:hypothetical protein [Mesorhizobium silamurunense]
MIPGLAAEQTHEALLEYANFNKPTQVVWGRYLLTAYITISLGSVIQHWSKRLLESRRPTLIAVYRRFPYSVIGRFPAFAVAVGFFSLQGSLPVSRYPYAIMAAGLIFAQIAYDFRISFLSKVTTKTGLGFELHHRLNMTREVVWLGPIFLLMTALLIQLWG